MTPAMVNFIQDVLSGSGLNALSSRRSSRSKAATENPATTRPINAIGPPDRFVKQAGNVAFGHYTPPFYGPIPVTPAGPMAATVPVGRQLQWPLQWQATPPAIQGLQGVQNPNQWLNNISPSTLFNLPKPDELAPCLFNTHVNQQQRPWAVQPAYPGYVNQVNQYNTAAANRPPMPMPMPAAAPPMPPPEALPPMPPAPPISPAPPSHNGLNVDAYRDILLRYPNGQTMTIEELTYLYRQLQQIQKYFHSNHITRRQNAAVNLSLLIEHYPSLYEPPTLKSLNEDTGDTTDAKKAKQFMDLISRSAIQMSIDILRDEAPEVRFPLITQYKVGRISYLPDPVMNELQNLSYKHGMYNFEPGHIMAIRRRFVNGRPRWESEPYDESGSYSSSPIPEPTDWTPKPKVMQPTSPGSQVYPGVATYHTSPLSKREVEPFYKRKSG
ncbi:MAG: hypothetical protein KC475_03530 [Cyanobacteria bacterium HKST-UBA03]|nr:hypothetical protein [Cyanobacteria bacterium HKST-UBA03]